MTFLQTLKIATHIIESIFHVLYEQNSYFIDRDELLETIYNKIKDQQLKEYKHRIAFFEFKEADKTQIALKYCYQYK